MNPINTQNIKIGLIGELLVQLNLLQYGIQAAPPLIDTGNDLIAIHNNVIKAIQVKTTKIKRFPIKPKRMYHILAVVVLTTIDEKFIWEKAQIYLYNKNEIDQDQKPKFDENHIISEKTLNFLFYN